MNTFDTFYILDLDRTLLKTDQAKKLYESVVVRRTPIPLAKITTTRQALGREFHLISFVTSELLKDASEQEVRQTMAEIRREFLAVAHQEQLFEPYAQILLRTLTEKNLPFGIVTTGEREWQQLKIDAAGLTGIPHLIIPGYGKGDLIASWHQPEGYYQLPQELTGARAQKLVFIDDKTISFIHLPDDVIGVRVISVTAKDPLEKDGTLPAHVQEVTGLQQVLAILFENYDR